jgi:hypothetical protein
MSTIKEKLLGQEKLTGMSATTVYNPSGNVTGIARFVTICNISATSVSFDLYLNGSASTYNDTCALYYNKVLAAHDTHEIAGHYILNGSTAFLAAKSYTANAITVTVNGLEIS